MLLCRYQTVAYVRVLRDVVLCLLLLPVILALSGCSAFISSATSSFAGNLSAAIINNDDLVTVQAGGPAYLLMVDGFLQGDPENAALLRQAADLYATYSAVFVNDRVRSQKLTDKALRYAFQAVCLNRKSLCALRKSDFQTFTAAIAATNSGDVPFLFTLGSAWAAWIEAHSEDYNAVAEISRVEAIMRRVAALDEFYKEGAVHLYLGTLATLLPPALGGRPEEGRSHFERAIELSGGRNLMAYVTYARQYARLVFDQELHERLLNKVLKAEPNVPGYVLMNTLAQEEARQLLESGKDYF